MDFLNEYDHADIYQAAEFEKFPVGRTRVIKVWQKQFPAALEGYDCGGATKGVIAGLSRGLSGKRFFGSTFGNRFREMFTYQKYSGAMLQAGAFT